MNEDQKSSTVDEKVYTRDAALTDLQQAKCLFENTLKAGGDHGMDTAILEELWGVLRELDSLIAEVKAAAVEGSGWARAQRTEILIGRGVVS